MNTHSNAMPESPLGSEAPAVFSASRLMYWSIRREFWENRSLYIAPLAAPIPTGRKPAKQGRAFAAAH